MAYSSPSLTLKWKNQKKQKTTIHQTQLYSVNLFGPQLPVFVTEAIAYQPGAKTNASVQLNPTSGWAWFVSQRKVFVWNLHNDERGPNQMVNCRELLLPPLDLALGSQHVTIFSPPDSKTASCIAVTPDGLVRYWEVVSQHSSWTDVNSNLGGEEVCAVHHIPPLGTLAVTTSATMIVITPYKTVGGTPTVKTTRISHRSWFSGISKQMNSLIFGSDSTNQGAEESKIVKVLKNQKQNGDWCIYLLAEMKMQYWILTEKKNFDLIYQCDLEPMIKKALIGTDIMISENNQEVVILDINLVEGGIMILVATDSPRRYILLHFPCVDDSPPTDGFKSCELSRKDVLIFEDKPGKVSPLKFLLLQSDALIFNKKTIVAVPMGGDQVDGDRIEIPGGLMTGHNMYGDKPVFFSATYGFVTISSAETTGIDILNRSSTDLASTPRAISTREPSICSKPDSVDSIKSAFLMFMRKNLVQCRQLIDNEFPDNFGAVNNALATTFVKMSLDIINDIPKKDPRWETPEDHLMTNVTSLHIETQLAEKQKAHNLFFGFIKNIATFRKLGKVTRMGSDVDTLHLLNEHNEKLIAISIFRKLQPKHSVIKDAISTTINKMKFVTSSQLRSEDFFYRYVSIADEGIRCLVQQAQEIADGTDDYNVVFTALSSSVAIIDEIVCALISNREKNDFLPDVNCPTWISAPGKTGIFDSLMSLTSLAYAFLENSNDHDEKYLVVAELLIKIVDIVLFLQVDYPELIPFQTLRDSLIDLFYYSEATFVLAKQLSFKYKAYNHLINLAYLMEEDKTVLSDYMIKFGDDGFCEVLFKWLIDHNKCGQILTLKVPEKWTDLLENFLEPSLYWVHKLKEGDMEKAAKELSKIALCYRRNSYVQEKMLLFAKLIHCAGEINEANDLSCRVDEKLRLIEIQKTIPESLIINPSGVVPVFEPDELIELLTLYVDESEPKGEKMEFPHTLRFMTALEIAFVVIDPLKRHELMVNIWTQAILKEDWERVDLKACDDNFSHIFFYQLMECVVLSGKVNELIPPINSILENEFIEPIRDVVAFKYIIQYAYDHGQYNEQKMS